MKKRLQFSFGTNPKSHLIRQYWTLILAGLAVMLVTVVFIQSAAHHVNPSQPAPKTRQTTSSTLVTLNAQQLKQYEQLSQLIQQLNRPPLSTLDTLEKIQTKDTYLLTLEQLTDKPEVEVTVETKDEDSLVKFWAKAQQTEGISEVKLLEKTSKQEAQYTVQRAKFVLKLSAKSSHLTSSPTSG